MRAASFCIFFQFIGLILSAVVPDDIGVFKQRPDERNIYCFKGFSIKLELQLAHNIDAKPCFCFDIIDVLVPITVV